MSIPEETFYKFIPFQIDEKSVDEATGIFEGYGSAFGGKPDSYGDIIVEGAYKKTLESGGRNGYGIGLLWMHDPRQPIGKWLELHENKRGLKVKGKLTKGVQKADEALLLLKDNAIEGLSIGYTIPDGGSESDEKKKVRYIKEIELWEISLVTFPANTRARVTNVKEIQKAFLEKNPRALEHALRDAGLTHKESKLVVSCCKKGFREEIKESENLSENLSTLVLELKKVNLRSRINSIL